MNRLKHPVILSTYSTLLSASIIIVLLVVMYNIRENWISALIGTMLLLLLALALFYMPMSVSVDDTGICVNRSLWVRRIPISEIASVSVSQPTMGEERICGSGGWFGYWGWFREKDLGKYFAYYGKASDCFLVRLKDGRQYMLGCKNPQTIVDFIEKRLDKSA